MRFEDKANTTALRMKKAAEAAYRRGDMERLYDLYLKAADYCSTDYGNAMLLLDIIAAMIKKLDSSTCQPLIFRKGVKRK